MKWNREIVSTLHLALLAVGVALAVAGAGCADVGTSPPPPSGGADAGEDPSPPPEPDAAVIPDPPPPPPPIDAAPMAPDATAELGAFGPAELVPGIDDLLAPEDDPSATEDLLEIYFDSERPGGPGDGDIWVARRTSTALPFGEPTLVVELSTADTETTPWVSYNGLAILFASDRPGGAGGKDLWVASRAGRDLPWSAPLPLAELNSDADDFAGAFDLAGTSIVFASNRAAGDDDLYVSTLDPDVGFSPPAPIAGVNTTADETDPFLGDQGRVLYFGRGGDLLRAERAGTAAPFGPAAVVAELDLPGADDTDPWLSPDLRTILFASDRAGDHAIYWAQR